MNGAFICTWLMHENFVIGLHVHYWQVDIDFHGKPPKSTLKKIKQTIDYKVIKKDTAIFF